MKNYQLNTLHDLLAYELKELLSTQQQLESVFYRMSEQTSDNELKQIFQEYGEETKQNQENLKKLCNELKIDTKGAESPTMEGIMAKANNLLEGNANAEVRDAGLITVAQTIAHYEMANYGAARSYALRLNMDNAANFLDDAIREEKEANKRLTELAEQKINQKLAQV